MMRTRYDVAVVGLGIMGASTLWRLALKGVSVVGLDTYGPANELGSSHGISRIFRRAYWEGDKYLPLLNHADELWGSLQTTTDTKLLHRTGGIFIGSKSTAVVAGSARTAQIGGVEHEIWTAQDIRERLGVFAVNDDMHAIYEPGAYAIAAQDAKLQMLEVATRNGAVTIHGQRVTSIIPHGRTMLLETAASDQIEVESVVVTTGPWISSILPPQVARNIVPSRVSVYWFRPADNISALFSSERFPVFLYEQPSGELLYGIPPIDSREPGVKIGFHNRQGIPSSPEDECGSIDPQYLRHIERAVKDILPGLNTPPIRARTCFYTMTRDESFLIGTSVENSRIHYASACSGHGFKFGPAVGDILATLAVGDGDESMIAAFDSARFD